MMRWAFRVARVAGIDIKVHVTFLLALLAGTVLMGTPPTLRRSTFGVLLVVALFVCVTLHELGHSLVARRFGVPVREIVLLPVGGMSLLGRLPERPLHEFLIAAAGPLVNVVIIVLLAPVAALVTGRGAGTEAAIVALLTGEPTVAGFVLWLLAANVTLVGFNIVPAFPLDGGRMLRAVLAMRLDYGRATRIATAFGQLLALGFVALGVYLMNPVLALVGVLVFLGGSREVLDLAARARLGALRVREAFNPQALTLAAGDRLERALAYVLTTGQGYFAVLFGRQFLGVVSQQDVRAALARGSVNAPVTEFMARDVPRVSAEATLEDVRRVLADRRTPVASIWQGEEFLGLISREDIARVFSILAAWRKPADAAAEAR